MPERLNAEHPVSDAGSEVPEILTRRELSRSTARQSIGLGALLLGANGCRPVINGPEFIGNLEHAPSWEAGVSLKNQFGIL